MSNIRISLVVVFAQLGTQVSGLQLDPKYDSSLIGVIFLIADAFRETQMCFMGTFACQAILCGPMPCLFRSRLGPKHSQAGVTIAVK
jgi:hypothetical protein